MQLVSEQLKAAEILTDRVLGGNHAVLAGAAGVGKSTLTKYLYDLWIGKNVVVDVITPSAKAADVLRRKGILTATTIHSKAYRFVGTLRDSFRDTSVPQFVERDYQDLPHVIIVDETSMVGRDTVHHLLAQCRKILFVGDHQQLRPVKQLDNGLLSRPTVKLRQIHRQAANSPIISLAYKLYAGANIAKDRHPGINYVKTSRLSVIADAVVDSGIDQIITRTNQYRVAVNEAVRLKLGREDPMPVPGDRVVCLHNNYSIGILNGQQFVVDDVLPGNCVNCATIRLQTYDGKYIVVNALKDQFGAERKADTETLEDHQTLFDFSYAITCHRAQGDQYGHVGILTAGRCSEENAWNYTATTRAENDLTIFI